MARFISFRENKFVIEPFLVESITSAIRKQKIEMSNFKPDAVGRVNSSLLAVRIFILIRHRYNI
jgi:hypothetical protein